MALYTFPDEQRQKSLKSTPLGSFTLVLHAHLPYVLSHGRWPHGTDWLCEAAAETYIPLLNTFNRLVEEGDSPRVTLGLTPVLCEMMTDPTFVSEFNDYLKMRIGFAEENARAFAEQGQEQYRQLARRWQLFYNQTRRDFNEKYSQNIIGAFKKLQDDGQIEIITSAATHGYLPLLSTDEAIRAQIKIGIDTYQKYFGRQPHGIWLPECAYRPRGEWSASPLVEPESTPVLRKGIEEFLAESGIKYFVTDAHLIKGGKPLGISSEHQGLLSEIPEETSENETLIHEKYSSQEVYFVESETTDPPVAVFARHESTSLQVWSADHGYPGNGRYLDFHKKQFPGGLRYWRVTDVSADLGEKQIYEPERITEICEEQATHFVELVRKNLIEHRDTTGKAGVVCCPYDAELFGHWWFEGPQWLYSILKKLSADPEINLTTGSQYLQENPPTETVSLQEGSWGAGGDHRIWMNAETAWTWKEIYPCERAFTLLLQKCFSDNCTELQKVLRQCARELLLMESSDWQFLISTIAARDYAEQRCAGHIERFWKLAAMAEKLGQAQPLSQNEQEELKTICKQDRCFPEIDTSLWLPGHSL